ncbi:porin family protein [Bdellovibrio reynosensis]|uniref:Porin family protein n=1 Tax=Bdellovibrio reynosensis TaxID=2835041 RepID=A0ABY4C9K1_9BACT|nr:porin family protein [Bdellovibrio reynosensis]UOF01605.1 porin family protein [Bdellovibrio reynosensis]
MKILIAALLVTSVVSPAFAIRALTIKNDRVLVDLEGESVNVGDKLGARSSDGKARAILEIKQIKEGRAVAAILKGKMQQEYTLSKVGARAGGSAGSSAGGVAPGKSWGVIGGYAMNSMSSKISNTTISVSGSSFNLSGIYQMPLPDLGQKVSARILGGYETFQAAGSDSGTNRTVDISYLGVQGLLRYSFYQNPKLNVWAGGGLGFLFAIAKSSTNFLDESKISTNQTLIGSIGVDYNLNSRNFIPVQFDYAIYPDSSTSSARQMILRAGYGFNF